MIQSAYDANLPLIYATRMGMQTSQTQAKMNIDIFDRANETHGPRLRSIDRPISIE